MPGWSAEEQRRHVVLFAVLGEIRMVVLEGARSFELEEVGRCGGVGFLPRAGEPASAAVRHLEDQRLGVFALGVKVRAVVGDGDMSGIHEVLEQDRMIIGELVDGGHVLEAWASVVLEPGEFVAVRGVLLRHPDPDYSLRVPHLVTSSAG